MTFEQFYATYDPTKVQRIGIVACMKEAWDAALTNTVMAPPALTWNNRLSEVEIDERLKLWRKAVSNLPAFEDGSEA